MKRILRIENWLLIVPVILLLVEKVFFGHYTFNFHIKDTYFVIAGIHAGIVILLFCWLLYLCHFSLRAKNSGSTIILTAHVVSTLLLLVFFFICNFIIPGYANTPIMPRRYYDHTSWQTYQQSDALNNCITFLVLAFMVIQLLFFIYTLFRLIFKSKS